MFSQHQFSRWERKLRTFFFLLNFIARCFYLATPYIPSGWMSCLSLHKTLSVFSNFLEKKKHDAMKRGCLTIKIQHPIVDVLLLCLFSFWAVWKLFFFFGKKKENQNKKTEGNCAPYGGLGENVPVTHLYVFSSLASFEFFPCFWLVYGEHCESLSLTYVCV